MIPYLYIFRHFIRTFYILTFRKVIKFNGKYCIRLLIDKEESGLYNNL